MKEHIEYACEKSGITLNELADMLRFDCDYFSAVLENEDLEYRQLRKIADMLNCHFKSYFLFPDGRMVLAARYSDMIRFALKRAKLYISQFAPMTGCSAKNFYEKLKRNKFTQKDLRYYAEIIGCKYIFEFEPKK